MVIYIIELVSSKVKKWYLYFFANSSKVKCKITINKNENKNIPFLWPSPLSMSIGNIWHKDRASNFGRHTQDDFEVKYATVEIE